MGGAETKETTIYTALVRIWYVWRRMITYLEHIFHVLVSVRDKIKFTLYFGLTNYTLFQSFTYTFLLTLNMKFSLLTPRRSWKRC